MKKILLIATLLVFLLTNVASAQAEERTLNCSFQGNTIFFRPEENGNFSITAKDFNDLPNGTEIICRLKIAESDQNLFVKTKENIILTSDKLEISFELDDDTFLEIEIHNEENIQTFIQSYQNNMKKDREIKNLILLCNANYELACTMVAQLNSELLP